MKAFFTIACAGLIFASCTKENALTASLDKVHADFSFTENSKIVNTASSLKKNDSTSIGGWQFDGTILDSLPTTYTFQFYVCTPINNPDNITGTIDFSANLSGLKLTDSVMNHDIVIDYIYTGTGKWRLMDQNGDLNNYFKVYAYGDLTYKYVRYTKDADGIPYDNSQYFATLDGFGR